MPPKKQAPRIFIVEPDAFLGSIFKTKLELEGYAVQVVPAAKRLETLLARKQPAAIIVDFHAGALGLLEKLRADAAFVHIPVIVTASYASRDDVERARSAGARAFIITTQVTPTELVRHVRQVLQG